MSESRNRLLDIKLPEIKLSDKIISISIESSLTDLFKTPKREYKNPNPENEKQLSLCNDVWLEVYSFLAVSDLVKLIITCKKLADLANEDNIREMLYQKKTDMKLKKGLKKLFDLPFPIISPLVLHNFTGRMTGVNIQHIDPTHPPDFDYYHDDPPGRGFVMKRIPR